MNIKVRALKSFYEKSIGSILYAGDIAELDANRVTELEGFIEVVDEEVFDPLTANLKTVKKVAKDMELDVEGKDNDEIRKMVADEMAKSYEAEGNKEDE